MLIKLFYKILGVAAVDEIYHEVARYCRADTIFQGLRQWFDFRLEINPEGLGRIPANGPVIFVANHPTGAMEGIALPALLASVRDDVMTLAHSWFERWPLAADRMFLVNPQAGKGGQAGTSKAMLHATRWLKQGGALLVFPAGEVARLNLAERRAVDSTWKMGLARMVRTTRATVLPIHLSARNSRLYYLLSLLHPRLGSLLLARELLNKEGTAMRVRVGRPIYHHQIPRSASPAAVVAIMRNAVDHLDEGSWKSVAFSWASCIMADRKQTTYDEQMRWIIRMLTPSIGQKVP